MMDFYHKLAYPRGSQGAAESSVLSDLDRFIAQNFSLLPATKTEYWKIRNGVWEL